MASWLTLAWLVAVVLAAVVLAGCGRVGYDSFETSADATTGALEDATSSTNSDATSSSTSDGGMISPVDANQADAYVDPSCMPACGLGYLCCQGTCYPESEPVPC